MSKDSLRPQPHFETPESVVDSASLYRYWGSQFPDTELERWHQVGEGPSGIRHYRLFRDSDATGQPRLNAEIWLPEANHGLQLSQFVDDINESFYVPELIIVSTTDSTSVEYEDADTGEPRKFPLSPRALPKEASLAIEALKTGADHPIAASW